MSAFRQRLAERLGKGGSSTLRKILESALTDDEARFLLELPGSTRDLAARYGMDEPAIEAKLLGLARRGLLFSSPRGLCAPDNLVTLHDGIMSSAPEYIPAGIGALWMELYEGEGWVNDLGSAMAACPAPLFRAVPLPGVTGLDTTLLVHEDIVQIIRAHDDLIAIRNCCCRVAARKCNHPVQTCVQFGARAEFELRRGSSRKFSADETMAIASAAGQSGLIPIVANGSSIKDMDFICFCCGCCCVGLNPGMRTGTLAKGIAPSRFVSTVDAEQCVACEECVPHCAVGAIEVREGIATVDRDRCLGCGACVLACPIDGGMAMRLVRPPEFIPRDNRTSAESWLMNS
jgi:electron transport complex protein RnfB